MAEELQVLYHGTDARIVAMTDDERASFKRSIYLAVGYLWSLYEPLYTEHEYVSITVPGVPGMCKTCVKKIQRYKEVLGGTVYASLLEKLMIVDSWKNGSGLYQYNATYLTSEPGKASRYAWRSFAFGELGLVAFRMITCARTIWPDLEYKDPEVNDAVGKILAFAQDEANTRPVVVKVTDYDPSLLRMEDGSETMPDAPSGLTYRYEGKLRFNYDNVIFLQE